MNWFSLYFLFYSIGTDYYLKHTYYARFNNDRNASWYLLYFYFYFLSPFDYASLTVPL